MRPDFRRVVVDLPKDDQLDLVPGCILGFRGCNTCKREDEGQQREAALMAQETAIPVSRPCYLKDSGETPGRLKALGKLKAPMEQETAISVSRPRYLNDSGWGANLQPVHLPFLPDVLPRPGVLSAVDQAGGLSCRSVAEAMSSSLQT